MSGSAVALYPKPPLETTLEAVEFPNEYTSWTPLQIFMTPFEISFRCFQRLFYIAGSASVLLAAWFLYNKFKSLGQLGSCCSLVNIPANNQASIGFNNNGEEVLKVVIHCCSRGFFVPTIETESLTLETFLRVARIPYEVNYYTEYEAPFFTYGDKIGNDFRECIRVLSEKFDVNLEKDVTASRKTAASLVDTSLENHFAWAILIWRWIYDDGKSINKIHAMHALSQEVVHEVSQRIKEATRYHRIGQLDKAGFIKTISQGIHNFSAALGKHRYFQGPTPGTVDCHAFAIFAQILWNMPGSPFESQLKKYSNLLGFVKRMKDTFWPDWSGLILKPKEFREQYNITTRQSSVYHRDSEEHECTSVDEGNLEKSAVPGNANVPMYVDRRAENVLPKADALPVLASKEGTPNSPDSAINSMRKPVGILKPSATAQRTKFVDRVSPSPLSQSRHVTFADEVSTESTMVPPKQNEQNPNNSNSQAPYHLNLVSFPIPHYPESQQKQQQQYVNYFQQPPTMGNTHVPSIPMSPHMFHNQIMPGSVPPSSQQLHHAPSGHTMGHNENEGLRIQKTAQVNLDAHSTAQQFNNNYHAATGIVHKFVVPSQPPKSPALLRF